MSGVQLRWLIDSAVTYSELKPSSTVGEFDLIQRYFYELTAQHGVELGIGDDAAVISLDDNPLSRLVVSMDLSLIHI